MHVGDTDNGKALKERIGELKELLEAYRNGWIIENLKIQTPRKSGFSGEI